MLHVVANVHSQNDPRLQRENLHQPLAGRVGANSPGSAPAHHLLSRQLGTGAGRALARARSQTRLRFARTTSSPSGRQRNPALSAKAIPQAEKMARASTSAIVVEPDSIQMEGGREAGPVHVGHQIWNRLGMNGILQRAGLSPRACLLSEVMTLNRLIFPLSERAMPDWIRRTALGDILQQNFSVLEDETLYRNLDRLHPNREAIERELAEREKTLFNLEDSVFLYDLTSTYFEGQAEANPQAKRGYSRDKRPDCKQVVVG